MTERPLRGAIQKADGKLTIPSVRFLNAIGIPFELPTGHQRSIAVEEPSMRIATEKNGGLVSGLASNKYDWVIAGMDTYYNLPDHLRRKVHVDELLPFGHCYYVAGVYVPEYGPIEQTLLIDSSKTEMVALEDLKQGTRIATKYEHVLNRIIREQERKLKRELHLEVIHDDTPETAPEYRGLLVVADLWEHGDTFLQNCIEPRITLFDSQAALMRKAHRFSRGKERSYERLHEMVKEGLANPELLLNPDTREVPEISEIQSSNGRDANKWDIRSLLPKFGKAAVVSTMLFALLGSSAILNPWHSRTSKEKDLN